MMIADAQVHIWAASTPERPWPAGHGTPHRPVPYSRGDLLREMDEAGVDRAVIVPPSWEGERNDLGLEAAQLYPDRFGVMGRIDCEAPGARGRIATWRQQPGMLGLRFTAQGGNPAADWVWGEAEAAGVPIMMSVPPALLHTVDRTAERYPALKLVIDHLSMPKGKTDDEAFAHLDILLPLARRPNIAVKATSLPMHTTDSHPFRRLYPHIRRVYDAFGPKRMFWGTDRTKLPCTYREAVTMFTEGIPWFTAEDKEWVMGRGLCEWIGWKMP